MREGPTAARVARGSPRLPLSRAPDRAEPQRLDPLLERVAGHPEQRGGGLVVLADANTYTHRVRLNELSRAIGRPATLDDFSDTELDRLAARAGSS